MAFCTYIFRQDLPGILSVLLSHKTSCYFDGFIRWIIRYSREDSHRREGIQEIWDDHTGDSHMREGIQVHQM